MAYQGEAARGRGEARTERQGHSEATKCRGAHRQRHSVASKRIGEEKHRHGKGDDRTEEIKRKRGRPPGASKPNPASEKKLSRAGKNWTPKEVNYLRNKWGTVSITALARGLGRSEKSVQAKANRMGLGPQIEASGFVSVSQMRRCAGLSRAGAESWTKAGLPVRDKIIGHHKMKVVEIPDFWDWAEQHRNLLDFSKLDYLVFGEEPEWVAAQRKADALRSYSKRSHRRWTDYDEASLKHMAECGRYTIQDMSAELRRSETAVMIRMTTLGLLNERGRKKRFCWTERAVKRMEEVIVAGGDAYTVAKALGTSETSVARKAYQLYGTYDLSRLRTMLTPKTGQMYSVEDLNNMEVDE